MKLSEFKKLLSEKEFVLIELPNGELVPKHFHVTEVGLINKHFIDCGGTIRQEKKISFQLWEANDYDHRIHPEKLAKIIELSEKKLLLPDAEIEVEYQGATIQKFGIAHQNEKFILTSTHTDCLAKDNCGIPQDQLKKEKVQLVDFGSNLQEQKNTCTPGGGCC